MPKIKNIIIFIIIAVAFILIYIFFLKPSPPEASLVSSGASALPNIDGSSPNVSTSGSDSLATQNFLDLFSSVKNIKLDDAVFADPAFGSLRDSSIILVPDGTEGRPNPFAQFDAPVPTLPSLSGGVPKASSGPALTPATPAAPL
jgi:hypothetical protein